MIMMRPQLAVGVLCLGIATSSGAACPPPLDLRCLSRWMDVAAPTRLESLFPQRVLRLQTDGAGDPIVFILEPGVEYLGRVNIDRESGFRLHMIPPWPVDRPNGPMPYGIRNYICEPWGVVDERLTQVGVRVLHIDTE